MDDDDVLGPEGVSTNTAKSERRADLLNLGSWILASWTKYGTLTSNALSLSVEPCNCFSRRVAERF